MTGIPTAALIACAVIVLALGALLSAGESALLRFTRAAADDLIEEGRRGATRVRRLAEHRTRVLGALSVARVAVDMLAAVLITLAASGLVRAWWQVLALALLANIILLGVVVGFSPRTYGRRNPAGTLLALGGLLTWVDVLAAPQRRLVSRTRRPESAPTDAETREAVNEDLREMIDEIGETDTIEDEDREMMRSVVELGQTLVREVMVPRTDMVTIDAHKPASAAMRLFIRSGYSRVPVIGEDADDVRGILYLKDVLRRLAAHPEHEALAVAGFTRDAEYVPEMKPADDLLREMQTGRFHMALAVDEYGGTAGLVTMEDLLEEVVGELTDEHDPELPEVIEVAPGTYRVPARLALDELGELFDLEIDDDDVDTVGGLLTKAIGRVPLPGAAGDTQGVHLQAEEATGRRRQVSTILASRTPAPEEDTDD
ncbi:HlyC/CorC family transporter [Actinomyces oris]|uniref:HlyC/CorC family transporter n=3 Tax=Actinomycetes TaxID=1760 RepID=A0A508BHA8_9ACTO|nr:hemolysin family protein [Actinomyces oris]QQC40831.1 HlyC/CorC family transporter [Actinomyces oris]TQD60693.1 HlyC/CorC family transporter [Actinomyces oris]